MGSGVPTLGMYTVNKRSGRKAIMQRKRINISDKSVETKAEEEDPTLENVSVVFHTHRRDNRLTWGQEKLSADHEELVTFMAGRWSSVQQEVEAQEVVVYRDTASEGLTAFKPLDLEAWWAGRIYKRLICG